MLDAISFPDEYAELKKSVKQKLTELEELTETFKQKHTNKSNEMKKKIVHLNSQINGQAEVLINLIKAHQQKLLSESAVKENTVFNGLHEWNEILLMNEINLKSELERVDCYEKD